ncbi:DUF427 domain-containing protein [Agromyces sp. MMS24-K17]|uniref:DUF427 domain-containing protein n=1 Tax=Agromyces sp. MMS24-K17 TaxID=3372850 RepID=UPI00375532E3
MKAIWNGAVLAESHDTVVVEGNHYFPRESLDEQYFRPSGNHSVCHWKGTADYFHVEVGDRRNPNAAWFYPAPSQAAADIEGRVAFWHGVEVVEA